MPTQKVPAIRKRSTQWSTPIWAIAGAIVGVLVTVAWLNPQLHGTRVPQVEANTRSLARPMFREPVRGAPGKLTHPLLTCSSEPADATDLAELQSGVRALLDGAHHRGVLRAAVHVSDLETCHWFEIGSGERFHPASLMKLPLALTWLRRASQDGNVLAMQLAYDVPDNADTREDRTLPSALVRGQRYEVADLLRRMLVDSRNDAKYLLTRNAPLAALDEIWTDLGLVPPTPDRDTEVDVHAIALMLHALYDGAWLGRETSERALGWLAEATYARGLTAQLPPGAVVAHKYGRRVRAATTPGDWQLQLHDCGVLYRPGHPVLVCVMTEGVNEAAQERLIQEIAALAWSSPQVGN